MPKVVVKCNHCENGLMAQGSGRQSKINRFNLRFVIKLKNLFLLILSGLDFSGDPKKVTLQRMSEVVVTWCHYQSDHWPKSGGWRNCFVLSTRKMVTMKIIVTTSPGANTSVFFSSRSRKYGEFLTSKTRTKGTAFQHWTTWVRIPSAGDLLQSEHAKISLDVRWTSDTEAM